MRSMKTRGLEEVQAARKRIQRLAAMGRVGERDTDYIVKRLKEVEACIVAMHEEAEEVEF